MRRSRSSAGPSRCSRTGAVVSRPGRRGARAQGPNSAQQAQALDDLDRAIRLSAPDDPVLARDYTTRGRLLHRERREPEALAACETALKLVPNYPDAHRLRLDVLLALKRYDDVIRSCDALLARENPSVALYELRGLARAGRQDYAGAIEDDTKALALSPDSVPLLARRGWLYLVDGRATIGGPGLR